MPSPGGSSCPAALCTDWIVLSCCAGVMSLNTFEFRTFCTASAVSPAVCRKPAAPSSSATQMRINASARISGSLRSSPKSRVALAPGNTLIRGTPVGGG